MAYLQSAGGAPIPPDVLRTIARTVDLNIPEEDLEALSVALRDQLASIERIEALDLTGIGSSGQFDPRWHD